MPSFKPLPPEFVLSRALGVARMPKDFDWVQKNIPCQAACPAGTDIPGYLEAIAHKRYDEAYRINLRDNVFPAVLGRVCTRPCEPACRHGWEGLGEPVAICFSKRSAADFMAKAAPVLLEPVFPETGKRVVVVGGGAAGLTVARELKLWGHGVVVFEQHERPGGLMVQGIPPFRLPRAMVEREIDQIAQLGVEIHCGVKVETDAALAGLVSEYDAVVIAVGTHTPQLPAIPGVHLDGVQHGLEFLKAVHAGKPIAVGQKVVVIGGGFTAVDCARTAKRLGAAVVQIYYRRSAAEMYITRHEIEALKEEGIGFTPQIAPVKLVGEAGRLTHVVLSPTLLGDPDESGRRAPIRMPDSDFTVEADTVLLGTGQRPSPDWVQETRRRNLFVAGDFAMGALSLIDAIGHAKDCARQVDTLLMGKQRLADVVMIADAKQTGRTRAMDEIPRQAMPTTPFSARGLADEVEQGFDADAAGQEAQRCYLCDFKFEIDNDLCIYCDRCLKVKPVEGCIVKISELLYDEEGRITGYTPSTSSRDYNRLYIDQNECIRCGACAEVCPVECIPLQRVKRQTVAVC